MYIIQCCDKRCSDLNRRQEDATMVSMAVDELDVGCGDFKVVEPASLVEKYERQWECGEDVMTL